jgi:hypothetical protein
MKCVTGKDGFLATNSLLAISVLFSLLAMFKSRITGTLPTGAQTDYWLTTWSDIERLKKVFTTALAAHVGGAIYVDHSDRQTLEGVLYPWHTSRRLLESVVG